MTTAQSAKPHPDLERLVTSVLALRPRLDDEDRHLALAVYRGLAGGQAVSVPALARRLERDPGDVERTLRGYSGVVTSGDGDVVGFWGLGLDRTPHRLELGDALVHTWCAWDPLFLVPLLGRPGVLVSRCPATGVEVRVAVWPDGTVEPAPQGATLSFVVPRSDCTDVRDGFCQYVHVFADAGAAKRWTADRAGTFTLTLAEGARLAALVNEQRYGRLGG